MLRVDRRTDIWKFVIVFAALQTALVVILLVVLLPAETESFMLAVVPLLVLMITLPVLYYIGLHLRDGSTERNKLRHMTERDKLTNAATRDHFYTCLGQDNAGYGVSVMVDIDHFKQVNDTHGHLVGDAVIRSVAEVLAANCRNEDIVCRFGGEEFVVFLHQVTPAQGHDIAERMRRSVEAGPVRHEDAIVLVTVSIGVAIKGEAEEIDRSIARADAALYRAKEGGRNQTVADWTGGESLLGLHH